ncbi:MAG: hypothetical protein QGG36_27855 [Pirellulaceae bacterium]|jgi:hypothetical protein|nr:hypothetical protein [Pirellulaceae bacterium]MDP7019643.1 hypothetical protein [Pirellulaceae bacterium]
MTKTRKTLAALLTIAALVAAVATPLAVAAPSQTQTEQNQSGQDTLVGPWKHFDSDALTAARAELAELKDLNGWSSVRETSKQLEIHPVIPRSRYIIQYEFTE